MTPLTRKIFSIGEIKQGWLLLLSAAICAATFAIDVIYDPDDQFWLSVAYYASFTAAAVWAIANYVLHLRLNRLYRKRDDIRAYAEQLALPADERQELLDYLEDFAADLERRGRSEEEAVREAITQFQVKEFLSMSKRSSPIETHGHHYLLGCAALSFFAALASAAVGLLPGVPEAPPFVAETVATVYGCCFLGLYGLYKFMDNLLFRTLSGYFR
jgi:hypothetical protein